MSASPEPAPPDKEPPEAARLENSTVNTETKSLADPVPTENMTSDQDSANFDQAARGEAAGVMGTVDHDSEVAKRPLILSKRFLKTKKKDGADLNPQWSAEIGAAAKNQFHSGKQQAAAAALASNKKPTPPIDSLQDVDFELAEEDFATDDEAALKEFSAAKRRYLRKVRDGTATETDEVEYAMAESREQQRRNRISAKRSYDEAIGEAAEHDAVEKTDNAMFCSSRDRSEDPAYKFPKDQALPVKKPKPGKLPKKDLLEAGSFGLKSHEEKTKRGPKKSRKPSQQNTLGSTVSKPRLTKRMPTETTKQRNFGPGMGDLSTLMGNNIVAIAQENEQLDAQPTFGSTKNRAKALNELIASLPVEQRKMTSSDREALHQAARSFNSKRAIQPDNGLWKVKNGMATSLKPHQLLGAGWMCERENSPQRPHGGMLCDDMGLGKTIQMIACMVDRRPPRSAKHRTTLIVVPNALTKQWLEEIGRHTQKAFERVIMYRPGNRPMTLNDVAELQGCDIVITTYSEVSRSYPRCDPPLTLTSNASKDAWWRDYYEEHRGTLHRVYFYRIVLDEAQFIKNHTSRTSIACRALASNYRWCLTGTPIQNGLEEFYPYFSFLRVGNTGEQQTFVKNYCRKGSRFSMDRLKAVLSQIMLRRTHRDRFMNRPIVSLPKLQEQTIQVEFNKVERAIYSIVKNRFIAKINAFQGPLAQNHKNIFVLFLRLRQLVSHPLLIQTTLLSLLEAEDLERLWKLCTATQNVNQEAICHAMTEALRDRLDKVRAERHGQTNHTAVEIEETQSPLENSSSITVPAQAEGFGGRVEAGAGGLNFRKVLQRLRQTGKWEEINRISSCKKCFEPAQEPTLLNPCGHIYCAECLHALLYEAAKQETTSTRCLECSTIWQSSEPLTGFEESGQDTTSSPGPPVLALDTSTKAVEKEDISWIDLGNDVLYSAKTLAAKNQIAQWLGQGPDIKIVVFVQFRPLVDILAKICWIEGWSYLTLTGDQSFQARDKSLGDFGKYPEKRILLASLKVGGLGLNLTMASRVLLLDLWWNAW